MYYPELLSLMGESPFIPANVFNKLDLFFASLSLAEYDSISAQFVAASIGISPGISDTLLKRCVDKGLLQKGIQIICPETGDPLEVYWSDEELPDNVDCGSCEISHRVTECKFEGIYRLKRILAAVPRNQDTEVFSKLMNIFNRFHKVSIQLRSRYKGRPTLEVNDEYDVQDLLHALLCLHFQDFALKNGLQVTRRKCKDGFLAEERENGTRG